MGQCEKPTGTCTEWHPQTCRWYKKGKCTNGDNCKWMHYDKDGKLIQKGSQSNNQSRSDKPSSPRPPSPNSQRKGKGKPQTKQNGAAATQDKPQKQTQTKPNGATATQDKPKKQTTHKTKTQTNKS